MIDKEAGLYSFLVPLGEESILVPQISVAEVIKFTPPKMIIDTKDWFLGFLSWNDKKIPVVIFNEAIGIKNNFIDPKRIIIFYSIGVGTTFSYFGLAANNIPQLLHVNERVLKFDSEYSDKDKVPILCRLKMANEFPLIPNFDLLEEMIDEEINKLPT